MLKKAYIRYKEDLPDSEMMFSALEGFQMRGVETAPFYRVIDIQDLDLSKEVGIVGYIGDIWRGLRKLGLSKPDPLDYPEDLNYLLGREIKKEILSDVRTRDNPGLFVKPVSHKIFTGFIMSGSFNDSIDLAPYPPDTEVWLSQVVNFISEFRCYVLHKEILGVHYYKGDWSKVPDKKTVEEAVKNWSKQPAAWTLDVGVTSDGKTLLVEVNDGFSIGNYGMLSTKYVQMLEARWEELVE